MDALPKVAACKNPAVCQKQVEEMAYRSCMMPTAGFENPPSPPSNGAGSLMNASSSNNCGQQTNHLLMMTPNRLTGPLGVRPMSDNGFSLKEPCNNRWSAVNGLGMSGQSSTAGTSGSLQFSDAESQRCSVTEMQGLLQRPPCHSYSGRPNQCVVQKRDSGREQTGSSGYAVFDVSAYSASDLRQNQSNPERSAAVLQEDHHFSGGHVLLLLPQETSSPVVGPTDRYTCRSSIALQQSSVGNWSFNDEIIVDSADGISQKSSNQKVSTSAAGAAAAGCPSSSSSLRRRRSQTPSDDNSSFGLSNQLMTKPTLIDCAETTHQSAREGGIELCNASNQPPSVIISSSLASSPTVKNNSRHISPDSALNDLLCLSAADDDSLVKESSGKATTTDGFCSNAIPSVCLLEKSRTVADKSVDYFGEDSPTDGHDSEKQSLINSFPRTEKSCRATEPRICSSVAEADRSSHLTDENFCEEKKLTVKRENSIIDDKLMSVRRRSPCAFAASNSFHALEIGAQVDGCNNGRDSTEEQSTGVNPPLDHPPLPPPAPPLPASLENANKEAVEASAVASVVDDNALFQSSAAAATTAVISRSLTCLSPAITNKGETNKSAERGLNELVSGEEEERGRGKRKRKVMSYSRYLEMSSSDDEGVASGGIGLSSRRKCLKTSHALMNSSSSDPIENSVAKTTTNGQQRKSVAASSSSRCRSNDVALVSVVDRDRRSSDVGNASTDIKSRHHLSQGSSASSKDSPVAAGQMSPRDDEQNARSALCPPASVPHGGSREKNSAAVAAKEEEKEEEAVDDKQQQQQHRVGREKELELEVTNENGEVEIVTIVDLHSSSDEADLLAMNGEDEIIPLTDNESDDAASSDCEHRQPDVSTEAAAAATAAAATAAAAQSMMQSVLKERLNCSSVTAAASSAQTPRVGLDLMHSASRKVDSKGRSDRVEQEADDMLSVAGPSHETKTSGTDRTTANKKPLRKKRKRVRPGDEFSEFGSDVEDNDKVHRLKKMYGSIQKQTKPGKTIIQMQSISAAPDKTTSSASGSLLGPYIRLIGSKETPPVSCKVVNVKDVDLDAPHSKSSKKSLLLPESSCVPSSLKFLDSVPWICLFCGHGSAYSMLGDLFGPYYPQSIKSDSSELKPKIALCPDKQSPPNKSTAAVAADKVLRSPRRLSSRLRTNSCDSVHEGSGNLPQELWVHEQCAVWTSGVYVARGKLQGLEEAAVVAAQVVCSSCHRMGATLGCYVKGCSQNYHYLCAVKAGCFFQEENFSVLCPKHRDKSRKLKGGHTE